MIHGCKPYIINIRLPWLTTVCLLITGAFLRMFLVVSFSVALANTGRTGVFPTTSPSPTLSLSRTISSTFRSSASALPSLQLSFSPSAPPTELRSLSVSPTTLSTVNVTWSPVGTNAIGTKDDEELGVLLALSAKGNEMQATNEGILCVYFLASADDCDSVGGERGPVRLLSSFRIQLSVPALTASQRILFECPSLLADSPLLRAIPFIIRSLAGRFHLLIDVVWESWSGRVAMTFWR